MIFGLDIASYQTSPNFALLKQEGHDFMITKVTGEGNYVNPYWAANRNSARAAGLIVGTYDWVEPQGALAPDDAAADYLRVIGQRQAGDLLCVDFETTEWDTGPDGRNIEGWMRWYLEALRDKSGQPVIVYTAPYFLNETGAIGWAWMCEANGFHLWQAAPGAGMMADDSFWPATPLPFHETLLHQHQWHATSAAVQGEFDRNRFRGTREELLAYGTPGGKVIEKKADTGFRHAEGFLGPPLIDTMDWSQGIPDAAGIVVARTVRLYNDETGASYLLSWDASTGFAPVQEIE